MGIVLFDISISVFSWCSLSQGLMSESISHAFYHLFCLLVKADNLGIRRQKLDCRVSRILLQFNRRIVKLYHTVLTFRDHEEEGFGTRVFIHQPFSRIFFVFFSKICKLECNTTSDWLNRMV